MLDLLFVLVMVGLLRKLPSLHRRLRKAVEMESAVVGTVAAVLLVYLFFSLIRPERF